MEKKKTKENVKTYILLTGLIVLCVAACIWTYYKNYDSSTPTTNDTPTEEELLAKTEELVNSKSWLSGADSTEAIIYVLTLRDLKEKYKVDVTDLEEKAKCDLDQTYVEVNAKAGKATYNAFLTCKNKVEKE